MSIIAKLFTATSLSIVVTACGATDRFANIGKPPALSAIGNPTAQAGYKPVQMPMPAPQVVSYASNSLWRSGSRTFFKDQRAQDVGDILTILVSISDRAKLGNSTARSRDNADNLGLAGSLGGILGTDFIPPSWRAQFDPKVATNITSTTSQKGAGSVDRSESIETNIAAVVTQKLPNGNLVIEGRQEVRVNFEVREMIVAGVIRPEDIGPNNTIGSDKIAEARISYGGRGQITDVQQPRYGQQVLDILLPF